MHLIVPHPPPTQVLSLYSNGLTSVEGIGVLGATPVREINLGQNLLSSLPDELAALAPTLERLWVDGNRLGPQLPACVPRLSALRVLRASNNKIEELPEDLGERLPLLEVLAVDNNDLSALPASVYALRHLETLIVRGNQIAEISEDVARLAELRIVQASSNRLVRIPEALGGLVKLEELYLNSNRIAEVPASLRGLVRIKKISLANNRIQALPAVLEEQWHLDGSPGSGPADAVGGDGGGVGADPAIVVELFGNPLGREEEEEEGVVAGEDARVMADEGGALAAKGAEKLELGNKRQKKDAKEA